MSRITDLQGLYDGDGTTDPVPTWAGPQGYEFIVHDLTTPGGEPDGFVLAPDGVSYLLLRRG
jgi:hypothetical protein